MKVKDESGVAQLCPTLSDPMDCRLPGSSGHGIFQARRVVIAFSDKVKEDIVNNFFSSTLLFPYESYSFD